MSTFKNKNFPLYSLFCVLFCCRFVWSQLSSTQISSMNNLSKMLNNSALHWDVNKEPCSWKGIKCNPSNTSVTGISLSGYSISSSLFLSGVCEIDSLQAFDVSNNFLTQIPDGFMTDCGKVGGLRSLNFSRNRLVGPLPKFVGFVGLEFLDLSFNDLTGNIGLELEGLDSLKSLNLSGNKFSGSVPTELGKSMALKEFVLSLNSFSGTIPVEITGYRNLTLIDLSQNSLSGSIPSRIGELSKLEILILSSNNLIGVIPHSLSNIETLWRFAANLNHFSGVIPSGITLYLRNFDLSYNNLTGSIPSDLLSGPNLQTLDLSFNSLEGTVPDNISRGLVRLRLGSNSLDGKIPSAGFSRLEKLTYLELDNNKLSGLVPPELGLCKSLALLNLAQNHLSGPVPLQLGNLSRLQVLKLQINDLSGEIPIQITQLQKLAILNISWNSLTGQIPPSISSLKVLLNLNLGRNRLNGSIPDTISTIDSLLELQLGENQLSGVIPEMPPNLQIALNLSNNLFEGPIPKVLLLISLEVLDLSNNNFSGEIPEFLTSMGSLNWLLLSNNSLSGVIPTFRPWTVVDTSGNKGLINATKSEPSSGLGKQNIVIIIVIAVAIPTVAGTIVAMSVAWYYEKKNRPKGNFLTKKMIHRSNIDFSKAMKAVSLPSNIVQTTRFSTYYKAIMPSGTTYFVKKHSGGDNLFQLACRERFHNELEFFGRLSNSNLMTPLAYVLTVKKAFLLYEFAPSGTLFDALHKSSGNGMDWACRYSVAVGVARALTYLHGLASGPTLLLDLSSRLIFLKSLKEPLIGDIELYKVIDPSKSTGKNLTTVAGSVGYIPPEYAYTMRVTQAGNVYSFGVVLLELLTGKPAVIAGTNLAKWVLNDLELHDIREEILDSTVSKASDTVRTQMLRVLKVSVDCVAELPKDRPVMNSALQMILDAE